MDLSAIKEKAILCIKANLKITMNQINYLSHCPGDIVKVGLCSNTLFTYFPEVLTAHIDAFAIRFDRHANLGVKINPVHKIWFLYLTSFSVQYIERHLDLICTLMTQLKRSENENGILTDVEMLPNLTWIKVKLKMQGASVDRNELLMNFRKTFYLESRGVFRTSVDSNDVNLVENLIYLIWNQGEAVQYYRLKQDVVWQDKGFNYAKLNVASLYKDVFLFDENEPLNLYSSILFLLN